MSDRDRALAWAKDQMRLPSKDRYWPMDNREVARILLDLAAENDRLRDQLRLANMDQLTTEAQANDDAADARRWRAVRANWFGADLAHPESGGRIVAQFLLPLGCLVSADPDATVDEAADRLAAEQEANQ